MPIEPHADRYVANGPRLRLACTKCGAARLIPLPQLDRLLFCNACRVCYRIERSGLVEVLAPKDEIIKVAVRTNSSEWRQHRAVIRGHKKGVRNQFYNWFLTPLLCGWPRWLVAAGFVLAVLIVSFRGGTARDTQPTMPRPTSLEDRAIQWTTALVRRDVSALTGLTDPAQHRALRIWLAHGTGLPEPIAAETPIEVRVAELAPARNDPSLSKVRLRISQGGRTPQSFDETWLETGGAWYFQPPKLRSVMPAVKRR